MFNKDFYPTPNHVIDMMGIDCQDKVWELLNRRYAKIKGQVLPEKFRI